MRRLTVMLAIAFTVALVAAPSAASAATPISAPLAAPPGFDPSSSKWRGYMLNVAGSVLGGAMPSSWKAEQIANQFALKHSPDALAAATGIGRGNPLDRIPETIEDYTAQEYERQVQRGTTAKRKGTPGLRIPVTPATAVVKAVGGVGVVLTSLEVGTFLGAGASNLLGSWFGYDPQGLVCSQTAGTPGGVLTSWVTGQDCSAWDLDPQYIPNSDAEGGVGDLVFGGATLIKYLGFADYFQPGPARWGAFCYTYTAPPTGHRYVTLHTDGVYRQSVNTSASALANTCHRPGAFPTAGAYVNGPDNTGDWGSWPPPLKDERVYLLKLDGNQVVASQPIIPADPERSLDCTVDYTDGTSLTTTGPTYKESSGAVSPPECPATPEGKVPENVSVTETQHGTSTPPQKVIDQPTTPESQEFLQTYPECADGTCLLDLVKVTPGAVVSCFDLTDGCADWFEDPAKTDNYRCMYASKVVDLNECNVYAGLFQPQRVEIGSPYTDPKTGTWSGGQTAPKSGQKAMTNTIQDPEKIRGCQFDDLGFDPVGWVLRPIQCAFEWAFIPRPSVVELQFATANTQWEGKPPQVVAEAVGNVAMSPSASGCSISTDLFDTHVTVVNFCDGPLAIIPPLSRMITTGLFALMVFHVIRQQVAGMAGYYRGQG